MGLGSAVIGNSGFGFGGSSFVLPDSERSDQVSPSGGCWKSCRGLDHRGLSRCMGYRGLELRVKCFMVRDRKSMCADKSGSHGICTGSCKILAATPNRHYWVL